ncbi:WYL domain-containing protein [Komagataeibacter europaeus]|uniref:WYL domain-containing protein n=1 Tax=Komagataeibacter europaeus TaxID=33995 RepID=UPI000366F612|nr:hypothetical protein [Komagataeibacter europaeus]GBQ39036.1 hypothetical protein AA18890_0336 [Komagataeibacter europaeus LMG 18890]
MTIIAIILVASLPGIIAAMKGRSFFPWLIYGWVLFPIAMIHVLFARTGAKKALHDWNTAEVEPPNPRRRRAKQEISTVEIQKTRIIIDYQDGAGDATQRTIVPQKLDFYVNKDDVVIITDIHAYCELRKAPRQFKYSRIKGAADAETGEDIPNIGKYLWLRRIWNDTQPRNVEPVSPQNTVISSDKEPEIQKIPRADILWNDDYKRCNTKKERITIIYNNDGYSRTERTICITSYTVYVNRKTGCDQIANINAFCELRDGRRAFLFTNIEKAWLPDTGEVLDSAGLVAFLQSITTSVKEIVRDRRETPEDAYVKSAPINIDYTEISGTKTSRTVVPHRIGFLCPAEDTHQVVDLYAYCEGVKDDRQFKIDRITAAVDAETRQTIPDIGEYLWQRRTQS